MDAENQMLEWSLVSLADTYVSFQRAFSQSAHRIPIVFLDARATEQEQPVPIRVGAIKFLPKRVSKQRFPRAVCGLGCP
jgi:FixJ family two-component response regulator